MTWKNIWIIVTAFLAIGAACTLSPAHAFLGLFNNNQERVDETPTTLTENIKDEAGFKKNTKMFADIPYNDTTMEYEIYLPSDWEDMSASTEIGDDSADLNQKLLGKIGNYQGPIIGPSRPAVSIFAVELQHEITAKDWIENYILNTGAALSAPPNSQSSKSANASYVSFSGLLASDIYTKTLIYGNIAILVQASIPLSQKEGLSFLQHRIVESFKLRTPKEGSIEPSKSFTITDALKFSYPDSWQVAYPDFKDSLRLSMQLQNRNAADKIDGVIQFMAVARGPETNIKLEIQRLKDQLASAYKLNIKEMTSSTAAAVYSRFIFARQEVYAVGFSKDGPAEKELWLTALGDKDWYIFIYLITPSRANSLYTWARNTRAFDLIMQSLK